MAAIKRLLAPALAMLFCAHISPSFAGNQHERVYLNAWQSIANNYYDREKICNWDQWQHQFDGRLHTRDDLRYALRRMLHSLGDDYTFVLSDDEEKTRDCQHKARSVSEATVLGDNIGYIRLETFSGANVAGEMRKALRTVANTNGLILDLRGNHGGYVDAARQVFAMLSEEGQFVSYEGFADGGRDDQTFVLHRKKWSISKNAKVTAMHRQRNALGAKPLAILVNEDTRSAAEMLAGALRDNGRAVIFGKHTFGKGVLQDTFDIGEHLSMKVVTAKYFLPSGVNIHEKGIEPDVAIDGDGEEQLNRAAELVSSAISETRGAGNRDVAVIQRSADSL